MEMLNLATREKQDAILSNFPISGGTDFSIYHPFSFSAEDFKKEEITTMLEIVGKGYISFLDIAAYSGREVGYPAKIIITMDDSVIVDLESIHQSFFRKVGLSYRIDFSSGYHLAPEFPIIKNIDIGSYTEYSSFATLLFFNSSLKVDMITRASGASSTDVSKLIICGGVEK